MPALRIPGGALRRLVLFTSLLALAGVAAAQRSGKEVVDTVCLPCHATGDKGAPKIGDAAAWSKRASQGLTSLTDHALTGIRNMPAHGGSPNVSNVEIQRAIVYMVNRSGGQWVEPAGLAGARPRGAEQIVKGQCAGCHDVGKDGAPKVGDRAAWTPRMARGLDALVASAVHGHGPMPARGGLADLSDDEIRSAIVYMFNKGVAIAPPSAPEPPVAANPFRRVVDGTEVYLGVVSAEALRQDAPTLHGGVPSGRGQYHFNISLKDARTQAPVTNAEVTLKVSDAIHVETRTLEPMLQAGAISYGQFFKLSPDSRYSVTAQIRRPGAATVSVASFDYQTR